MKKLFSLILVALISTQIWAVTTAKTTIYLVGYTGPSNYSTLGSAGTVGTYGTVAVTCDNSNNFYSYDFSSGKYILYTQSATGGSTASNAKFTVTATPQSSPTQWSFMGWYNSSSRGTNDANRKSTNTSYKTDKSSCSGALYALFERLYTVSASANDASYGSVSVSTTSVKATVGTSRLTATKKDGYHFVKWTENNSDVSTSNPLDLTNISANRTFVAVFEADAQAEPDPEPTTLTAPDVVDLGPNVSVLWSTKNLGAENATDPGYYYAWGEIEPKSNYSSTGYTSPYTTFADANDVARQKLGAGWRMPTWTEVYQLINYCNQTASTAGLTISGNEASIFLPNTGYKTSTNEATWTERIMLWTKTEHDASNAKLIFAQNNANLSYTDFIYHVCYDGLPVRAVYDGPKATATFMNGTKTEKTQRVIPGTAPTAPANPTKDADEDYTYAFTGWSTSPTGSVAAIGNINSNTTYYAQFSATPKPIAQYTVTITSPSEGTGTLTVTAGGNTVNSGAELNKNTVITVTATPAEHYTGGAVVMQGETPVALTNNQFTLAGDVTISTNFGLEEFTIRFIVDGTPIQTRSEEWGATPISPNESTVQKPADKYYTYSFAGWDANDDGVVDGVSAVSGDQDYVAVFNRTSTGVIPTYNITIGAYSNGTVTLTAGGDVQVVPTTGGVYPFEDGTNIIVNAIANRGWHFTQWNDANTSKSRQISEIAADITLTPTFATNVSFPMYDTWTQSECASNYNFVDVLTVTLVGRTFTAGQWATLSVPFTTTLTADDALYNAIYKFNNVTLSAGGSSVFLEFVRTNDIEKNQPYLVVPRQAINEVVFDGVKLEAPAQQAPTTDDRVAFVSSLWQQEISGPNDFYIGKLSTLYYAPNSGMTIKGNRAFFRKIGDAVSAPRRAIFVIDGEEVEVEIAGDAIEEVQDVRKYMENGILIIERNGVRMDAQGKRIN